MEINYVAIGERIREIRTKSNLTQAVLAERAGIEPSNLSHIERAATKVSLPTLISIANALEVSLDELVYGSLIKNSHVSVKILEDVLSNCTPYEQMVLSEFLNDAIKSFRKFKS
ncbi:MAG: helix-turn-helix domain-containing protein [Clostridia bacterium]|nr:helix-turn-helix domain-containing protein [Clostridia bacterium]